MQDARTRFFKADAQRDFGSLMIVSFEREKAVIRALLQKLGVSDKEANATAEVLAEADLRGLASHGILRLP